MTAFFTLTGLMTQPWACLLYTSDAADERSSVDLGGRRIIKKKTPGVNRDRRDETNRHRYHNKQNNEELTQE